MNAILCIVLTCKVRTWILDKVDLPYSVVGIEIS